MKKAFLFTLAVGEVLLGALAIVGILLSGQLIGLFRDDGEVIRIGTRALQYQLLALFFQPITICATMLFQSVGANRLATVFSMLRSGVIFIPLLAVLHHFIGLYGVQSAQAVTDVLTFAVTLPVVLWFMNNMMKKTNKN